MSALILVLSSLLLMLWRVATPFGQKTEGREILTVRLGLRERMLYHRTGLYAFAFILMLMALAHLLRTPILLISMLACYAILTVPIHYRLTTAGIGVNSVVFRRWSEFDGVSESSRAIALTGRPGINRFAVRLLAGHQAEALAIMRRKVRASATAAKSPAPRKGGRRARHALR